MLRKSLPRLTLSLTVCIPIIILSVIAAANPGNANILQPAPQGTRIKLAQHRRSLLKFKVPAIRPSGNLEPGAARGSCGTDNIQAVLPPKPMGMKETEIPIELTLSDRPTFFISIPETSTNQAEFLLQDETGDKILLNKKLRLTNNKGIVNYTLEPEFTGLQIGQKYRWQFSLICDPTHGDRSGDIITRGWIERVTPSPEIIKQLQTDNPRDRVTIYANNGYWHDTLKILADLRAANPNDSSVVSDWFELFRSVGLDKIAKQPISTLEVDSAEKP
ncbi:MAG: DUF928 domain-containing protein [Cuspidothrix sp.]